jgi:hypothetical protein
VQRSQYSTTSNLRRPKFSPTGKAVMRTFLNALCGAVGGGLGGAVFGRFSAFSGACAGFVVGLLVERKRPTPIEKEPHLTGQEQGQQRNKNTLAG